MRNLNLSACNRSKRPSLSGSSRLEVSNAPNTFPLCRPRSGGSMNDWNTGRAIALPPRPKAVDPLATMPVQEPQCSEKAARRILRDLTNLHRYESRAVTRRDRAIRTIELRRLFFIIQFKIAQSLLFCKTNPICARVYSGLTSGRPASLDLEGRRLATTFSAVCRHCHGGRVHRRKTAEVPGLAEGCESPMRCQSMTGGITG